MSTTPAPESAGTPAAAADRFGSYRHPWRVAIIAGLASFVDGAALTVNGIGLVIYQQTIGLTPAEVGILTALVTAALAIGALVGGRLGDLYGRRKVFIVTMVLITLGSLAPTFATEFWILFAGLAVMGFAVGADLPVSLATIAEAATDKNRGKMLVFSQVMWIAASLVTVLLTTATGGMGRASGQILFGMISVVALIGLLLRLTVPESPMWLRSRDERRRGVHTIRADKVKVRDLLQKPYKRPFIFLAVFYALVLASSTITGSFSTYIAATVVAIPVAQFVPYTLILFPIAFIGLAVFMKFVDGRARMPLFIAGGVIMVIGLLLPVLSGITLFTVVAALGLSALGQISAGEPIARVWGNEAFPTLLRSTGQGIVFTFGRIVSAVAAAIIPAAIAVDPSMVYLVSAIAAALGVVIGYIGFRNDRSVNEFQHEQDPDVAAVGAAAAGTPTA
ncbi:MFS transporter [Paenarthrobacter nicotinovorans]|uniref:MFS transporter n=1 Tax=Paenarthrobacter nicotinovorans TaxID=29320 RepID=UPI003D66B6AC